MPNKRKVYKYKIGDWVTISGQAEPKYADGGVDRIIVESVGFWGSLKPKVGQIVGATHLLEGRYYKGYQGYSFSDPSDFDPPYFEQKRKVFVWKVRTGLLNKAYYAFEHQLEPHPGDISLPAMDTSWNHESRARMSKESEHWPRDSKGRWICEDKS